MSTAPEITGRAERPYVAVKAQVTMQILKYNVIDMARQLEIEAGVPVAAAADGGGSMLSGVLPAGRYVTMTYAGSRSG